MTTSIAQDQGRLLDGAERAAAVLLALNGELSQRILKYFDQSEMRKVALLAAGLGSVPPFVVEGACGDLIDEITNGDVDLVGNSIEAENLLSGVLPEEEIADIMSEIRGSSNRHFWRRVASLPEKTLADHLAGQHPQIVAIVIAKVDPGCAARVLGRLPGALRASTLRRMLVSKPVNESVLRLVETTLQEELFAGSASSSSGEVARVAGIINQLERDQVEEILHGIATSEPATATQLRSLLFSFEDIVNLDLRARTIIFDEAPTERVILALRGADAVVCEAVLPCLSARTRRMVEAELASGASPPKRDIAVAERQIAETVLRLADQGMIELPVSGGASDLSL